MRSARQLRTHLESIVFREKGQLVAELCEGRGEEIHGDYDGHARSNQTTLFFITFLFVHQLSSTALLLLHYDIARVGDLAYVELITDTGRGG